MGGVPVGSTTKGAPASANLLPWLRADLPAWIRLADDAKVQARIRQTPAHWQKDTDGAGLRDPAAVAKLPAGEQQACQKLWVEVEALLKKIEEKK